MAIIVTETLSFILVAFAMIVLVHYVEKWLALESQINVLPGEFIDKYSQRARHIKMHRKRHKTPENLFFDSRRDIYVINEEDAVADHIHYHWGRYRRPLPYISFHHESENEESYFRSLFVDLFAIMQSIKLHVVTRDRLIWIGMSDRLLDTHFFLVIANRSNLKKTHSFEKRLYLPMLVNFSVQVVQAMIVQLFHIGISIGQTLAMDG